MDPPIAIATPVSPSPGPGLHTPLRIFIVENHEDTRFLLGLLLEQLGHTVVSVATMQEALQTIPGARCDVLISDVGLPDGNGWELLKKLGADRPRYAIAMSGFGMSADRERSRAAGYRHHLLKPVEPNELETLLDQAAAEAAA
jgi:CheY-like chemotaxis protein